MSGHDDLAHPSARGDSLTHAVEGVFTEGIVLWLVGICFMAGWTYATAGVVEVARCVSDGFGFVVVGLLTAFITRKLRSKLFFGVSAGIALAMGVIMIEMAFPVGAASGSIWNSIGGAFPDKTELGNRSGEGSAPAAVYHSNSFTHQQ